MSKIANKMPMKPDVKGPGDHKREPSGNRNDRERSSSRSHGDSRDRGDAGSRSKTGGHSDHHRSSNSKERAESAHNREPANDEGDKSETKSTEEKKFTGRCRLFVGNLTPDVSEDDFKKMFQAYGEVSEVYLNSGRGFGFIRLDYRQNAEAAKAALDGFQRKGRVMRVRFATHGAALKVKNLHPYVSNELLEQAFTQFGDLERAIVIVDDRGKPTGEGLVEFVRKPGAQQALRRVNEGVFLFGADPKPIEVEPLEQKDDEDGMPEIFLPKNDQYKKEREKDPYFAPHGSFEYEFGMRWKQMQEMEKKKIENVKKEMEEARIKLEDEMENALYEYQADQIRRDLLRQQEELRRLEELRKQDSMRRQQELEMRVMNRRAEEERERQEEERRRQQIMMRQQEMQRRSGGGPVDAGMSRSREDLMGMRGEASGAMRDMGMRSNQNQMEGGMRGGGRGAPPMQPPPAPPSGLGLEQRGQQQGMGMERGPQGMDRAGPQGMDRGPQGMDRGPQGMDRGGPQGVERGRQGMDRGPQGIERGPQGMDRGPQGIERGPQGMDRGPQGMDRGGPGMDRGPQAMNRGPLGIERGPPGMERGPGPQGPGMERGAQGVGMERGPQGVERGPPGASVERGPKVAAVEGGQPGAAMERAAQPGLARMAPGAGGPGQGSFGGQNGMPNTATSASPTAGGSPSVPNLGKMVGQGGPGNPMGPDGDCRGLESSSGVDDDTEPALHPAAALSESEDILEEWIAGQPLLPDCVHLQSHPHSDAIPTSEQLHTLIPGDESGKCEKWMFDPESMFEGSSPYIDAESGGLVNDSFSERNEKALEADNVYYMENSVCYSDRALSNGDIDRVDEAHPCPSLQRLLVEKLTLEQNGDITGVRLNSSSIDKDQPLHELGSAEVDSLTDDRLPSEAEVSASESLNTSHSTSPASSSSPHHQHVWGSGSNTASSATGVPLQQGHPGMVGQTCFVRVHPMHVAAAVAAQHSRAAAVTHQRQLMAAAAAQQRAAVVAQQQRIAAAAAHQRSQAAMMQQHLVRSRFVGAPVVVRPPAFVPVPGIATPVRVRMRLHRSVTMTEEYSVDRP